MPAPGWLRWTLAVAMLAVALYHLGRLVAARWRRVDGPRQVDPSLQLDVELTHAAMGSTMTVMVVDAVAPVGLRGLGLVFVAALVWFASRTVYGYAVHGPRGADVSVRQIIGCAAMAYMLLVLAAPSAVAGTMTGGMTGMSMTGTSMGGAAGSAVHALSSPVFRVLVASATVGVAGWTVACMRVRSVAAGPALSLGCQLAVSATTVYMLVAM